MGEGKSWLLGGLIDNCAVADVTVVEVQADACSELLNCNDKMSLFTRRVMLGEDDSYSWEFCINTSYVSGRLNG